MHINIFRRGNDVLKSSERATKYYPLPKKGKMPTAKRLLANLSISVAEVTPCLTIFDIIRYIYFWKENEEDIVERFELKNSIERINAFKDYLSYMKVARNFKKGMTERILKTSEEYINSVEQPQVHELSQKLLQAGLLSGINKKAYVACSKILWLFNKSAIIMDNNNIKALSKIYSTSVKTYEDYEELWKACYREYLPKIDHIIKQYALERLLKEITNSWFKQRIFDMFLWHNVLKAVKNSGT